MGFKQDFLKKAKQEAYTNIAFVDTKDIEFEQGLRLLCDQNACGHFNTSWTCPPACGSMDDFKEKIISYKKGVLLQKVYTIQDSFDFESMREGQRDFDRLFFNMMDFCDQHIETDYYSLKAGSCHLCKTCTYPDSPCVYPEKARPSLEACGINVSTLCGAADIPYMNGKNTVSYVAMFLY